MATERDRLAVVAWREEQAAIERAEREERERPIREAQATFDANYAKLHNVIKERVTSQVDVDGRWADPILDGTRMTDADALRYNTEQFEIFKHENPDVHLSAANVAQLFAYQERNQIFISTAASYLRAWNRLAEFGLLETAPEPEPTPEPEALPTIPQPEPELIQGWDDEGNPKTITPYQESLLSGDELLKFLRISKYHYSGPPMRSLAR